MYIYATPRQVAQWRQEQKVNPTAQQTPDHQEPNATCVYQKETKLPLNQNSYVPLCLLLVALLTSLASLAQSSRDKSTLFKEVSPASDHYKTISSADATARDADLETIAFPEKDFRRGAYLKMRTVYLDVPVEAFKIQPYPANSSEQTRKELDFLLELQEKRTAEDEARTDTLAIVYHDPFTVNPNDPDYPRNVSSLFYVGRNLGVWFSPEQLPVTSRVLQNVIQDATFYFFSLKAQFNRARPYHLEPRLKNLEAPGHASYPSGHSSASHVHAYLLSNLLPEYREQFLRNAYDLAFSREVRGVHYPSDSEAGRAFAKQFVAELMKSKKFNADYAAMKAEIEEVKSKHSLTLKK
ncbi:acid phosphatase (class A) [Pontibacter ummariensis]|uniref:Acid phosphatase (Class A) n=2 Tax=Pontibacter ummariensis TaxID=1610492 RepID=A0A239CPG7_9BACT|nr:acid phosphatase (class A) [Pontibacter ummariensis]SNS22030.1 acid phosphatase (class A) [Pontibacter ummariensis]